MVELHARARALATTSSDVVISADHLVKTYQYHRQQAGLVNALKSLVHREYQTRVAVKGIDLAVDRGEIVGLLGPNGAGKTTTLKMLTGLLRPSDGAVSVLGFQPWQRDTEFLRRIALVMGQKSMLWWDVSAMESLLLHKDMYGLDETTFRESVDELAELLDVRQHLDIQVRRLSLGERMKLELMVALVHRPEVLFLDEPTIGLDVVAKARVRTFLGNINRYRGTTIVITSHDMDDIEALCQRVMIMTKGEIEFDGDLTQLVRATQPRKRIRIVFGGPIDLETVRAQLPKVEVMDRTEDHSDALVMIESPRDVLSETLSRLPLLGPVIDIDVSDSDIDEIIRELFTRRTEVEVSS